MQKYFNKKKFYNKIKLKESNLKHILKTKQINQKQKKIHLENQLIKCGFPPKNHHTTEIFIEPTYNGINEEIALTKPPKYSNLSKGEQNTLEDLQERDDIVNANKEGAAVIINVANYIEKAEDIVQRV